MTTNTTSTASQAPAVSASQDSKLMNFLADYAQGSYDALQEAIAHIDAKLAQANLRAKIAEECFAKLTASDNEWRIIAEKAEARATALEAQLAAIRDGIAGLTNPYCSSKYSYITEGFNQCKKQALALLQPQAQADTSGLPD